MQRTESPGTLLCVQEGLVPRISDFLRCSSVSEKCLHCTCIGPSPWGLRTLSSWIFQLRSTGCAWQLPGKRKVSTGQHDPLQTCRCCCRLCLSELNNVGSSQRLRTTPFLRRVFHVDPPRAAGFFADLRPVCCMLDEGLLWTDI